MQLDQPPPTRSKGVSLNPNTGPRKTLMGWCEKRTQKDVDRTGVKLDWHLGSQLGIWCLRRVL